MKDKILIIEDEPAIADNIAYPLKTEGFEPFHCPTGREGKARKVDWYAVNSAREVSHAV